MGDKIRFTGMSGIDTQSMIEQLMKAESMRKNALFRNRTSLDWRQEAYRSTGNAIKNFQNSFLSFTSTNSIVNMRSSNAFSSNETKAKTSTGEEATGFKFRVPSDVEEGTYKFKVDSIATNEIRIGSGSIFDNARKITLTNISDSTLTNDDSIDLNFNGKNYTLEFSGNGTNKQQLEEAIRKVKLDNLVTITDEGITVDRGDTVRISEGALTVRPPAIGGILPDDFSVNSNRFESAVTLKDTENTAKHTFKITVAGGDEKEIIIDATDLTKEEYLNALNTELAGSTVSASLSNDNKVVFTTTTNDTVITDANNREIKMSEVKTFTAGGETINVTVTDGMTKEQYVAQINRSLRSSEVSEVTASINNDGNLEFNTSSSFGTDFILDGLDSLGFTNSTHTFNRTSAISALGGKNNATTSINLSNIKFSDVVSSPKTSVTVNGVDIDYTQDTTIQEFMDKLNSSGAGVKLSYSSTLGSFTLEGTEKSDLAEIQISSSGPGSSFLDELGVGSNNSIKQNASSAQITYYGKSGTENITLTRNDNTFLVDGITIELKDSVTIGEEIAIEVNKDTTATKDNIMKFIAGYNDMLDSVQGELSARRPKSGTYTYYEPLLDEERNTMSDREIELWEENGKIGLLYGDSLLRRFTSDVRSITYNTVTTDDGTKISLQSLGITTGNYFDGGKLIIDEDKLTEAINNFGGDNIYELFTKSDEGVADLLNSSIESAVGTTGYISNKAGFENTLSEIKNSLSEEMRKNDERLIELEKQLRTKEDYYYLMFSRMEQAIMESNNQMSYMMSF